MSDKIVAIGAIALAVVIVVAGVVSHKVRHPVADVNGIKVELLSDACAGQMAASAQAISNWQPNITGWKSAKVYADGQTNEACYAELDADKYLVISPVAQGYIPKSSFK